MENNDIDTSMPLAIENSPVPTNDILPEGIPTEKIIAEATTVVIDSNAGTEGPRMIPYNSGMPHLVMPEYGRNVQNLIDYCCEIEDREERTACALAIADVIKILFPSIGGDSRDMKKVYDQMKIISGFKLDVDFPCETITKENANPHPARLPYSQSNIRFRHYGSSVERMVREVCKMENSEEKDEMVNLLANHMKKLLTIHNKENATDARVLHDLAIYSLGHIMLDPETYPLMEFPDEIAVPTPAKKRKKKR